MVCKTVIRGFDSLLRLQFLGRKSLILKGFRPFFVRVTFQVLGPKRARLRVKRARNMAQERRFTHCAAGRRFAGTIFCSMGDQLRPAWVLPGRVL